MMVASDHPSEGLSPERMVLFDDDQELLERASAALHAQAETSRNALAATGQAPPTDVLGKSGPTETILTAPAGAIHCSPSGRGAGMAM